MSIKTDAAYAAAQLRTAVGTFFNPAAHDSIRRALDALERIEAAAPDEGDPAGTPAVTDLSCRVLAVKDAWRGAEWMLDFLPPPDGPRPVKDDDRVALIDSHSTCGPAGRQTFPAVAVVFDLASPNPGVLFKCPTTVGLTERVVAFLKTRPWETV